VVCEVNDSRPADIDDSTLGLKDPAPGLLGRELVIAKKGANSADKNPYPDRMKSDEKRSRKT
jgi:hypothetical protein